MDNKKIAQNLNKIAKQLEAIDFPNQQYMNDYLRMHPLANRKNHRVVEPKTKKNKKEDKKTNKKLNDLKSDFKEKLQWRLDEAMDAGGNFDEILEMFNSNAKKEWDSFSAEVSKT